MATLALPALDIFPLEPIPELIIVVWSFDTPSAGVSSGK